MLIYVTMCKLYVTANVCTHNLDNKNIKSKHFRSRNINYRFLEKKNGEVESP